MHTVSANPLYDRLTSVLKRLKLIIIKIIPKINRTTVLHLQRHAINAYSTSIGIYNGICSQLIIHDINGSPLNIIRNMVIKLKVVYYFNPLKTTISYILKLLQLKTRCVNCICLILFIQDICLSLDHELQMCIPSINPYNNALIRLIHTSYWMKLWLLKVSISQNAKTAVVYNVYYTFIITTRTWMETKEHNATTYIMLQICLVMKRIFVPQLQGDYLQIGLLVCLCFWEKDECMRWDVWEDELCRR